MHSSQPSRLKIFFLASNNSSYLCHKTITHSSKTVITSQKSRFSIDFYESNRYFEKRWVMFKEWINKRWIIGHIAKLNLACNNKTMKNLRYLYYLIFLHILWNTPKNIPLWCCVVFGCINDHEIPNFNFKIHFSAPYYIPPMILIHHRDYISTGSGKIRK